MDKEEFEAMPNIDTLWEDPATTCPRPLNGSVPGGGHNYKHPMETNLAEADERLPQFCANTKGTILYPGR